MCLSCLCWSCDRCKRTNPVILMQVLQFLFLLPTYISIMIFLWKKLCEKVGEMLCGEEETGSSVSASAVCKHDVILICTTRGWAHWGGALQIYSCANSSLVSLTFSRLPPWTKQQALHYELFKDLWELLLNKNKHQCKTKEWTLYFASTMLLENGMYTIPKRISRLFFLLPPFLLLNIFALLVFSSSLSCLFVVGGYVDLMCVCLFLV